MPKSNSGHKTYSDEELEQFFEAYRTAPIAATTCMPSLREVSRQCAIAQKTVKQLRDLYGWESRRLRILEQVKKKADAKRVTKDVSKVKVYENLEKAGLNFQTSKVYKGKNGQAMSDLKVTDIIALGKHVEHLKGEGGDDPNRNSDRPPINVIFQLPDNGMVRKHAANSSRN